MSFAHDHRTGVRTEHPAFVDVVAYAEIMAALRNPYSDRQAVLDQVKLSDAGLARLRDHWCARFASGEDGAALREKFEVSFRAAEARRPVVLRTTAIASTKAETFEERRAERPVELPTFLKEARLEERSSCGRLDPRAVPIAAAVETGRSSGVTVELEPSPTRASISARMPFSAATTSTPRRPLEGHTKSASEAGLPGRPGHRDTVELGTLFRGCLSASGPGGGEEARIPREEDGRRIGETVALDPEALAHVLGTGPLPFRR